MTLRDAVVRMNWRKTALRFVEMRGLVLLLLVALAGWGFLSIADEVMEGDTHALDEAILLAFRGSADLSDPIGPDWVEELMRDVTGLGGIGILTILTVVVAIFLWIEGRRRTILYLLAAVVGGTVLSAFAKELFDRPRPDLVLHETIVSSASFPSGHSMMAAVVYLTLAVILVRGERRRAVRWFLLGVAAVVVVAIGVSRVYLGVHWPSDVLAGWSAGAGWALLCWWSARWLGRRGDVEPAPVDAPADTADTDEPAAPDEGERATIAPAHTR